MRCRARTGPQSHQGDVGGMSRETQLHPLPHAVWREAPWSVKLVFTGIIDYASVTQNNRNVTECCKESACYID